MIMPTPKGPDLSGCASLIAAFVVACIALWQLVAGDWAIGAWAGCSSWLLLVVATRNRQLAELRAELAVLRRATRGTP